MPDDISSLAAIRGLSGAEVQARLRTEGYNELPRPDRRTPLRIILEVLREPMLALLLGGGVVYLLLGDLKEALILLVFAMMSVVITFVQEVRTERVLEALRDLTSPRALVTLGMSMLPEEFPVVLTVFMAMGAWRISRARVLTRRAAAIETLGSATVLCTDKTGTLTQNRMSIAELRLKEGQTFQPTSGADVPEAFHALIEFGILGSAPEPFDPMDKAFHDLGNKWLAATEHIHGPEWKLVHSYGLRPGHRLGKER